MDYVVNTRDVMAVFTSEDGLRLKSLVLNGKERACVCKAALPQNYIRGESVQSFHWELSTAKQGNNGFDLLFADDKAQCRYLFRSRGRGDICGPIEVWGTLTNIGAAPIRLVPGDIFSAELKFDGDVNTFHVMKESWLAEGVKWYVNNEVLFPGTGIYSHPLTEEGRVIWTSTDQDPNAGGMIPMLYLTQEQCGAYLAVEWTSCRIKADKREGGAALRVDLGADFATNLPAGGEFRVPPVYLGVYDGDLDDGSNLFKRWFFLEKTPKSFLNDENEPYTQMDMQLDLNIEGLGIQSLKWDYGWWGASGDVMDPSRIDKYYEGSWKLRSESMAALLERCGCKTMAELGWKIRNLGLNWTVYVLLHDSLKELSPDEGLTSVGANGHPEWFSDRRVGGLGCPVADLGNEACVDFLKRKMFEFFTQNNVRTWRSDFEPIARSSDKANRHDANGADVQYWCSAGFYDLVDYLIENIPGFRYESCSSGGSMKDFATMHRTCAFNNDDSANFDSLRTTFYDSTYCFPPAQLQNPVNPDSCCPECEKYYAGVGDKDFGFRAMIMGGIMLASWSGSVEHKDFHYDIKAYYEKYINLHNEKIKPLIRNANLYHILPRPDGIHWDGMQYGCDNIPENRICGASFLFKPSDQDGITKHIPVRGLNPEVTYQCTFYERTHLNFTATGADLLEKGFDITIEEPCGSEIVFFVAQ